MDEIRIRELKVFAYHGVYPRENEQGQDFYINAALRCSTQRAGISDDLEASVSYEEVCELLQREMKAHTWKLLEAAAEHISAVLFAKYALLQELVLEIRKPDAPIDADFASVSVCIRRKRHVAYVAYGANEGDCEQQIEDGIAMLDRDPFCMVARMTKPLKSTPYGGVEQSDFYNGVIELQTVYEPVELLHCLQGIEKAQGRERKEHWGPRTLDLDILLYDDLVYDSRELTIPHPDMMNRDFVMLPLSQLASHVRHPLTGKTIGEMARLPMERHVKA
ncbi:MAG: 2-amino-4-hydroxy-6-hydroxymethyldihydropteridine diphosphokinase [Lachnospiraceae bacterium]|nr:2-amino-4-hydroxy-6-hydroxymethyldihydropteridine diphosphokinase [Lachnospiraceae bacterium]